MEETKRIPERSEIAKEDTWATEDMFASDEAWEQELATVEADKEKVLTYAGRLGESADVLYAYLSDMEAMDGKIEISPDIRVLTFDNFEMVFFC